MATRPFGLILPVFAALGVACGADRLVEPDPVVEPDPAVLDRIELTPPNASLFMGAPYNKVQLVLRAYDQDGAPAPGYGDATYSSSAPGIATVSGSGVVTAVAPGTAEITASLTLGSITRTDSITVTVYAVGFWDIEGVYDLTARITSFDSAWGVDLTGYRYTAVLTLGVAWDPPWLIEGRYADLRIIGPDGDTFVVADTGSVISSIDSRGRLLVELVANKDRIGLYLTPATLASGVINGTFGCCGHIGGTFTATHR